MPQKTRITDPDEIRRQVAQYGRWWHEIELAPGIVTPGDDSNRKKLPVLEELGLAPDLVGLRALDIGCSDGYFSFELEKRGAKVTAMDFVPETYTGFSVAKEVLGSSVTYRMDNVYNLKPEDYGHFDIVFFLGVLYHLRKPLAALDSIRSVMKPGAQLFVATFMIDEHIVLPNGSVTTLQELNPVLKDIPLWQAYPATASTATSQTALRRICAHSKSPSKKPNSESRERRPCPEAGLLEPLPSPTKWQPNTAFLTAE